VQPDGRAKRASCEVEKPALSAGKQPIPRLRSVLRKTADGTPLGMTGV